MSELYKYRIESLLLECDDEFVPPLSRRSSTTQTCLTVHTADADKQGIRQYFEELIKQDFIIAKQKNDIIGFLSFIENYRSRYIGNGKECTYISTIIVERSVRGQGIARSMYREMLSLANKRGAAVATRTWSGNHGQLKILKQLGFDMCACIPNDRGKGIDTVYFCLSN